MVLTCSGSGVPVPEITWMKDGAVQATGRGQADLPLREVTWQAGGLYQCHANNGVGQEHIKVAYLISFNIAIAILKAISIVAPPLVIALPTLR